MSHGFCDVVKRVGGGDDRTSAPRPSCKSIQIAAYSTHLHRMWAMHMPCGIMYCYPTWSDVDRHQGCESSIDILARSAPARACRSVQRCIFIHNYIYTNRSPTWALLTLPTYCSIASASCAGYSALVIQVAGTACPDTFGLVCHCVCALGL